jgi:hypothetical protein
MDSRRRDIPRRNPSSQALIKEPPERSSSWANMTVRPCKPKDDMFKKWDRVRDEILSRIDLAHVYTIGCYRVGSKGSPRKGRPTIIISGTHTRHPKEGQKARDIINKILKRHNLAGTGVDFREGRFRRHASDVECEEDEPSLSVMWRKPGECSTGRRSDSVTARAKPISQGEYELFGYIRGFFRDYASWNCRTKGGGSDLLSRYKPNRERQRGQRQGYHTDMAPARD